MPRKTYFKDAKKDYYYQYKEQSFKEKIQNDLESIIYKCNSIEEFLDEIIISIRQDVAKSNFCFPQKIHLLWKLKDLLEEKVDEKYYLSEKGIRKINKKK